MPRFLRGNLICPFLDNYPQLAFVINLFRRVGINNIILRPDYRCRRFHEKQGLGGDRQL